MKKLFLCLSVTALTACNAQIAEFVRKDKPTNSSSNPSTSNSAEGKMKITPGALRASGSQAGASMTILAKEQALTGSQTGAKLSISEGRMD